MESETAVETTTVTNLVQYNETEKKLVQLRELYTDIPDCETKEGYEVARSGIRELVSLRTGLESTRKSLKSDAIAYGRKVDAEASRVKEEIQALELPLKSAKKIVDDRKEAERETKRRAEGVRVDGIKAKIAKIQDVRNRIYGLSSEEITKKIDLMESYSITEEAYHEFTEEAKTSLTEALDALRESLGKKINEERVAKEQEAERLRLKEEQDKLAEERRVQEAELQRQRDEAASKQAEIDAENKRKADELALRQQEENQKRQEEINRRRQEQEDEIQKRRKEADKRIEKESAKLDKKRAEVEARESAAREAEEKKADEERRHQERIEQEKIDRDDEKAWNEKRNEAATDIRDLGVDESIAVNLVAKIISKKIRHVTFVTFN